MTFQEKYKKYKKKYTNLKNQIVPKLIVFDLDETLWPFNCANDENFNEIKDIEWTIDSNQNVYDNKGKLANCYPDVKEIIGMLYDNNIDVAYATHNPYKNQVTKLLKISPIQTKDKSMKTLWDAGKEHNGFLQAYGTGSHWHDINFKLIPQKTLHFNELKKAYGLNFNEMLFFDDCPLNIETALKMGIPSILLKPAGLTWKAFNEGIKNYLDKK